MPKPLPNQDRLLALGEKIETTGTKPAARHAKRKEKKHKGLKRAALAICVVVVLLVATVVVYVEFHQPHRVTIAGLTSIPNTGAENILMIGSTSRCALKVQTPAFGICATGVNGVNSDVIMILHLNPNPPGASILSLPRTLFVPNARKTGANKIDAALYQGPAQLVATIEEDFGIPIQHIVELNFDTFAAIVTSLGGITMYFPEPVFDAESGLNVPDIGCHHLNGFEALQVVRARHLQYKAPTNPATTSATWPQEPESDLARIRRDHEFLRVLAAAVTKKGLSTAVTDTHLVSSVLPNLTVDSGFSLHNMVDLLLTYHSVNAQTAPQLTLPVSALYTPTTTTPTYPYQGGNYGDIEFPSEPQDQNVIDQLLGVTSDTNTLTNKQLPSPNGVSVSVLNGSGTSGEPTSTATALGKLGFQITGTGTTTVVAPEVETLVTYAHKTPADEAAAQLVARSLSGSVIMAYGKTVDGAEVTVTTGTGFSVNATAPKVQSKKKSTTTTKASSSTTTSTTTPTASLTSKSTQGSSTGTAPATTSKNTTPHFTPPSASVQALAPWDPRSCTANGGEGS